MRLSTVVKKDTASCDIVHGSSRFEINGETIMRRSTVVKKGNVETIMRHSTGVKKDTASCDIVHGSSRSGINWETIMRRSTVLKKDKAAISDVGSTKRQGFQHISQVASEFRNALPNGKRGMTLQSVEDLEKEGYTFVYKDNSVWKQMPCKKVMTRVRKSLTDYRNKSKEKGC
jgi:hypothetical protein